MKKIAALLLLLSIILTGFSQVKLDYTAKPKSEAQGFSAKGLSASSARFLYQLRQVEATTDRSVKESLYAKLQKDYGIIQGKVSAIIGLAAGQTPQDLKAYDVTVGTVSGDMVTAMIPVIHFAELAASGVCTTIDVGEKQHPMMDKVRSNLGIDQIHAGMHLPQGYDGSGVVVGIIDIGLEYCHPTFYDVTGTTLRVKRVWNQKDSTGTAPSGYSYGSEYTTEAQMAAARTDDTIQSHGTHVASIAAGCGAPYGHGAVYRGIAPGADIVLVPVPAALRASNIIDGINYIYSYAQSVNKSCVINMSFGTILGPHDGTGYSDRLVRSFVEQHPDNLVIVSSAGNKGSDLVHLEKQFSPVDTILTTQLENAILEEDGGVVSVWGDENFTLALTLLNTTTGEQVDFTGFFSTDTDTLIVVNLLTSDNDTVACEFGITLRDSVNHRVNADFTISSVPSQHQVILTVRCDTTATVHAWCDRLLFRSLTLVEGTVDGDSLYSIEGFVANTDAVISVGAYNTRLSYNTYTGGFHAGMAGNELGGVSSFSSLGPTIDGRVKPDITAPGSVIASASNRYDHYDGSGFLYDTIQWNGQQEEYCTKYGTSMSAPMVTGIVALWMQHNPSLGVDSVRAILHRTAHNDRFTGNCVTEPNNTWGHGKVNAFGGLPADTALWLLNAFEAEDGSGCVEGGGVVVTGMHTLTAVPATNFVFLAWEDGSTDNPRTVNVTCDTTFFALFSQLGYEDCDTIEVFPWAAEFDENLTCWIPIDADGDGQGWSKVAVNVSSNVIGAGATQDNWLVSPAILVNQPLKVKVTVSCVNPVGSQGCSLLLSTTGGETTDFTTELLSHTFTASAQGQELSAMLNDYQGQAVRIALRHHNCTEALAFLVLNNFTIEIVEDSVSVPSYEGISNYSVSTHGLQLNISKAEGHALQIYDLTGRLVLSSPVADGHYLLPSSGVYILRVDGFNPRKIMVMR